MQEKFRMDENTGDLLLVGKSQVIEKDYVRLTTVL